MLTAFLLGRKIGRKIGRIRSLDYIVAYLQGRINLKDWGKKRGRLGENSMLYTLPYTLPLIKLIRKLD